MTDETAFAEAAAIPDPAARAAYLDRACEGNPTLRRAVDELLAAHFAPGPLDRTVAHVADAPAAGPAVGTVIAGRYKLLEPIGEGGMGTVFMAEQTEPVRRLVAVKLIRPGMDSKAVLARFEAERQALAIMDHPNIAKVLDAGATADGRPFFVMELVKGVPITQFCDANRLPPRQRLELFVPVCQAIQHAHQKGVIHRDVKPTNVLVAQYDGRPVPKVIDFGVAKAAGQPLTELTLHTGFGAVVGTPEYMSPEQATFNQLDVDTRSDVYALGVLLYELLTGTTPVDRTRLNRAALLEVLRVVREEEPPRPSARMSTAEARASLAAVRGTEPAKLSQLLRGELDWIVMKALEKDRNRRYDTAAAFARDVERFLNDELVEARPPTPGYRLRKFLRAHRQGVLVTLVVGVSNLVAWGGVTWQLVERGRAEQRAVEARDRAEEQRAEAERLRQEAETARTSAEAQKLRADGERFRAERGEKRAVAAAEEARDVLGFLADVVINSQLGDRPDADAPVTLHEALAKGESRLGGAFHDKPVAEAEVRHILGSGYARLLDTPAAVRNYDRAVALRTAHLGPNHPDTLLAVWALANVEADGGDRGQAVRLFRHLRDARRTLAGTPDESLLPAADMVLDRMADACEATDRWGEAVAARREAVALVRGQEGQEFWLAVMLSAYGNTLTDAGRAAEAEPVLRECLRIYETHTDTRTGYYRFLIARNLGECLLVLRKFDEAEQLLLRSHAELARREGTDYQTGPVVGDGIVGRAAGLLVRLYAAKGDPAKAAEWRAKVPAETAPRPRVVVK